MSKKPKKSKNEEEKPPFASTMERFPEYVNTIGMISIEMANLELCLADLFGAILDRPRSVAEAIYFTPNAMMARISMVDNATDAILAQHPNPEMLQKKIKILTKRARSLMGKRHEQIHNAWGMHPKTEQVQSGPLPVKSGQFKDVPLGDLTEMLSKLRKLITEINDTNATIHAEVWTVPSHEKS